MKTFALIMEILAVLAAIAGVVFLVVTYGDKISAWFKKMLVKVKPVYSNKRDFECENADDDDIAEVIDDDVEEDFEA